MRVVSMAMYLSLKPVKAPRLSDISVLGMRAIYVKLWTVYLATDDSGAAACISVSTGE